MSKQAPMPPRADVDPLFDGQLERSLLDLSVSERLDWIWESMQLLRMGRSTRVHHERESKQAPPIR